MAGRTCALTSIVALASILFVSFARSALGTNLVVPDHQPTIQAALDLAPDTVLVRSGDYREHVWIRRPVAVLSYPSSDPYGEVAVPHVRRLTLVNFRQPYNRARCVFKGIRFEGPVRLNEVQADATIYVTFESCRLDSGIVSTSDDPYGSGILMLVVQGCTIRGGARLVAYSANVALNAILGGGLRLVTEGYHMVRGNYISGPASVGIDAHNPASTRDGTQEDNTIEGVDVGMRVSGHAARNEILDCAGSGIEGVGGGVPFLRGNLVRRCGGNGITVPERTTVIAGNVIDGAGGVGIRVGGTAEIDSNVVGRCGGPGIIAETLQAASVTHNTSYLNRGSGIVTASYSLSHNVSFGNKGYGLEWGGGSQDRGCNDWFANESGAVKGGTPDPTDVAIDPLFCDIVADDVRLRADSPLLDAPGCGLIGALGMGCEAVASILPSSHEGDLGLVAYPLPARGGVQLSWKPLGVPGRIEIFDVSGALRWAGDVQSGSTGVRWPADGKPITSGAYFARLSRGGVAATAKVVLVGH